MGLIIPKCNAHPKTLEIALGIYYEKNDWVDNAQLIDILSQKLFDAQIETDKKEPQSYTKKTQVLSYYGLLEWEDPSKTQSRRRITPEGREFYETLVNNNLENRQRLLLRLLSSKTFGRNVLGCDSDSDLEVPNIFVKSCMLIGDLTNKEFAYILGQMEFQDLELADALLDLVVMRKQNKEVPLDERTRKWADPKPILALADWGVLTTKSHGNSKVYNLNKELLDKYSEQIAKLRIRNTYSNGSNNDSTTATDISSSNLQLIYFGTPGSGKSYKVQERLKDVSEDNVFRTTFHPDSDYASFVGCYKPIMLQQNKIALTPNELKAKLNEYFKEEQPYPVQRFAAVYPEVGNIPPTTRKAWLTSLGSQESMDSEIQKGVACGKALLKGSSSSEISYSFIPQVFTNAYVQAWKKQAEAIEQKKEQAEKVYLVIEEINRGNCAQIFGDLFQLLDRNEDGTSTYKIRVDQDLANYLMKELGVQHPAIAGGNLRLPANLHILATMNTSDQSLFPMDSAFKRRWDWEYVPIDYSDNVDSGQFIISIGDKKYRWVDFLQKVNARILSATDSEDKQMGNFFIKHSVEEKAFKNKVMFYLWHEVCKDEFHTKNNFFRTLQDNEEKEFSFNQLHEKNGTSLLEGFMQYLEVKPIENKISQEGDGTPNDPEENNAEE